MPGVWPQYGCRFTMRDCQHMPTFCFYGSFEKKERRPADAGGSPAVGERLPCGCLPLPDDEIVSQTFSVPAGASGAPKSDGVNALLGGFTFS